MSKRDKTPHDMDTCPLCKLMAMYARGRRARERRAATIEAPPTIETPEPNEPKLEGAE